MYWNDCKLARCFYLCHKWPQICSVSRDHNPVLSSLMTYHWVCYKSNKTGATSGAGTTYPFGASEFVEILLFTCLNGLRVVNVVKLHVFTILVPCCDVRYDFCVTMIIASSLLLCVLFMLFVFIYVICIYLCYLYLLTYNGVQHDFHIRWCSCRVTITRRVSLVEKKLLTLPESLSSPSVFSGIRFVDHCLSVFFWALYCLSFDLRIFILWHL